MKKASLLLLTLSLCLCSFMDAPAQGAKSKVASTDSSGFMLLSDAVPEALQEIRYHSAFNFVGSRIDGYEQPCALITKEAGAALKKAAGILRAKGYGIKVFDAYRPTRAVAHFIAWSKDASDTKMKKAFYPELDKESLFKLGFIAKKSSHSRGSTVDLTIFDINTGYEIDMGGHFDFFGDISYSNATKGLSKTQISNRKVLRNAMVAAGFQPLSTEWWHFTLKNEPYPNTYFDFPVNEASVKRPCVQSLEQGTNTPAIRPCAYQDQGGLVARLFNDVLVQHRQLRAEVVAFLEDPEVKKEGDQDEIWSRYDKITAKLEVLKAKGSYTVADVKLFSKEYFEFCLSIDKVTDSTNVSIPVETRLGAISDLLKEIAALIEGREDDDADTEA